MKAIKILLLFTVGAVVCSTNYSRAQTPPNAPTTAAANQAQTALPDAITMTSAQLDVMVQALSRRMMNFSGTRESEPYLQMKQDILTAEEIIVERLKQEKYVQSSSLDAMSKLWTRYEGHSTSFPPTRQREYPNTVRFVDRLTPLLADRPDIQALLLETKLYVLQWTGQYKESLTESKKALEVLDPLILRLDKRRQLILLSAASNEYWLGNKEAADKLYYEATAYPWYKRRGDDLQEFRALYVTAIQGLIETRRGNLEALKQIFPAPAVSAEVGPLLKRYIVEASTQ